MPIKYGYTYLYQIERNYLLFTTHDLVIKMKTLEYL